MAIVFLYKVKWDEEMERERRWKFSRFLNQLAQECGMIASNFLGKFCSHDKEKSLAGCSDRVMDAFGN